MRIQVEGVERAQGATTIAFRAECGTAIAGWASEAVVPVVGAEYDVELDLDLVLDRATNTRDAESSASYLSAGPDAGVLQARVEGIDEDGMAHLRLSPDALILVVTSGAIAPGDAIRVSFPPGSLRVTPFAL